MSRIGWTHRWTLALPLLLGTAANAQTPLGMEFTYQGRLTNAGSPANGLFDMDFNLYPVPVGGAPLASQMLPDVSVTNGLFTVQIDFGAGAFDGNQRWLELAIDGTLLAPRQELRAAPNALFAVNTDQLDGLDASAFLQSVPVPLTLSGTSATHIIRGENDSGTADASGVSGVSTALGGFTRGVYGRSDSSSGHGVFGSATSFSGTTFGGRFESASGSGLGIFGFTTSTLGVTTGVSGRALSTSGRGVVGVAAATSGTTYGVYGQSDSPAATAYGVWAQGRLGASGTKSFRIDHPDDPSNRYLLHYAAESPEVINFYSETVTLDERGEAVVELPYYFAKINTRPRYQLTAVGAPMPALHVTEKISESALRVGAMAGPDEVVPRCSFRIAGGAPGGEVSWEVKALRNDRWVRQHGAPVEVAKQEFERGTYQHPELYGQPPEKGLNFRPEAERSVDGSSAPSSPNAAPR
ncbi:MAG: hypothetical protein AB7Q17_12045 [Phycisphaerae bacterium]